MSLVPWRRHDAPTPLRSLQTEIDRLFEDFFDVGVGMSSRAAWIPAVKVSEGQNNICVDAELPGMDVDDVEVTIINNVLLLRGERKEEQGEDRENVLRREFSYGVFTRQIPLPSDVDAERAEARMEKGVLHLVLPKAESAKQRRIEIRKGDGDGDRSIAATARDSVGETEAGAEPEAVRTPGEDERVPQSD
jgi:HSP20 family protein